MVRQEWLGVTRYITTWDGMEALGAAGETALGVVRSGTMCKDTVGPGLRWNGLERSGRQDMERRAGARLVCNGVVRFGIAGKV